MASQTQCLERHGNQWRVVEAAKRIRELAAYQLLVVPYSDVHEDETHQWKGHDELLKFIKDTSRGYEFEATYTVERNQLSKAFQAWRTDGSQAYGRERRDAVRDNLDVWDAYYRIEVGRYHGDIELIRELKGQAVEGLVDLFPGWRNSTNTFAEDVLLEHDAAMKGYVKFYAAYVERMLKGDFMAELDSR